MSKLIAIEGIDGASKNTQAKLLADKLGGVVISFPNYETETGKLIKKHLKGEEVLHPIVFQSLQTVNKLEALNTIKSYIYQGIPVVLDRYYMSAMVYGGLDGLSYSWLEDIHSTLPKPDLWIFLDITKEESFKRRPQRRDTYEENMDLMGKARESYLNLFKNMENGCIIDASGTIEEVHEKVLDAVNNNWKVYLNKVLQCLKETKS